MYEPGFPLFRRQDRASYALARWLFLRLLGGVYLVAFLSLSAQILGLVGERGILPAADALQDASSLYGPYRYSRFPTLVWLDSGDGSCSFCAAGASSFRRC
jgi:hypothetical protein